VPRRIIPAVRVNPATGCWDWIGNCTEKGYGRVYIRPERRYRPAHRAMYERLMGPVAEGIVIHHRCENPGCINPQHLEPLSAGENVRRGPNSGYKRRWTICPNSHPYTPENTKVDARGYRLCRVCERKRGRQAARRQRLRRRGYLPEREPEEVTA